MNMKKALKSSMAVQRIPGGLILFFFLAVFTAGPVLSSAHAAITPNEVYGRFDLAAKQLDVILKASGGVPDRTGILAEKGLKPMHVYQMAVSCIEAIHIYQLKNSITPVPIIIATPRKYTPGDVLKLADIVVTEVNRIARHKGIQVLGQDAGAFSGKTPTHVFSRVAAVYLKISALSGLKQITPNEVFAQMFRAQDDAKSILGRIDPARRYRVDVPDSPPGLTPGDVLAETLKARESLNETRAHFGLTPVPVPVLKPGAKILPTDVFIQTQIIIAEMKIIKIATGTVSATPLPVPVTGKTPSDVHQQAVTLEYLLGQIGALEKLVKIMETK
ncbi:MAG: hypothetical protein MI863_05445 [Desulfobacterales bacterium]|nr:hypothetical protein [Desulfobacterales bacterium]